MSAVWRWISLGHLFHEGGRTLLTLAGGALGVAVFRSVPAARADAHGQTQPYDETRRVLGIDPFSEGPFGRYQAPARAEPLAALTFMVDPRAVAITRTLADRRRLRKGDSLRLIAGGRPV